MSELKSNYNPAGSSFTESMEFDPTTTCVYSKNEYGQRIVDSLTN